MDEIEMAQAQAAAAWEQPQWMTDCIDHYRRIEKRGPTTSELLTWREADASCRMERKS